jgi:hypothetical protein
MRDFMRTWRWNWIVLYPILVLANLVVPAEWGSPKLYYFVYLTGCLVLQVALPCLLRFGVSRGPWNAGLAGVFAAVTAMVYHITLDDFFDVRRAPDLVLAFGMIACYKALTFSSSHVQDKASKTDAAILN